MNIQEGIELYQQITQRVDLGASARGMATMSGYARNMAGMFLTGRIYLTPMKPVVEMTEGERNGYYQGFHCVEIVVEISWGGNLSETVVRLRGYDRRARWDGPNFNVVPADAKEALAAVEALCASH